jgi:membrane protein DedA with SNARE-associated domain
METPVINAFTAAIALAAGTLVSEDLTCIAAGQLVASGAISPLTGCAGCFAGIYVGDLGLWLLGHTLGRGVRNLPWIGRRVKSTNVERLGAWFDANAAKAIVAARFVPGMRLPMYLAAGALGRRGRAFAGWTLVAALIWTPILVLLTAWLGDAFVARFRHVGGSWLAVVATVALLYAVVRLVTLAATREGRSRITARVARLWQWEFWPAWVFYAPLALWIGMLSLRRGGFRGFSSITAANPGIPHGGFVGESKSEILSKLGSDHVSPTRLIPPDDVAARLARFDDMLGEVGWSYPLVLKPDVGQRGAAVKLARCREDAADYLLQHTADVIVQPYHPGPFEAGIFYFRIPGELRGQIFSITDKQFPEVIGDGVRTLEQLIWDHPRYRMQAATFLARHDNARGRVLAFGERLRLAFAGNHCQGTLFRDGTHLVTRALQEKIDDIAKRFPGFCFGRFDVRYSNVEAFRAGADFTILELNGITSESTNIYDPRRSLLWAYRTLMRQWSIVFRVADASIRAGNRPSRAPDLLKDVLAYYRHRERPVISD